MTLLLQQVVSFDLLLTLNTPLVIDLTLLAAVWTSQPRQQIDIVLKVLGLEFSAPITLYLLIAEPYSRLTKDGLIIHSVIRDPIELGSQVILILFVLLSMTVVRCDLIRHIDESYGLCIHSIDIIRMEHLFDLLKVLLLSHHLLHLALQITIPLVHLVHRWNVAHRIELVPTLVPKDVLV